eukprot:gnl/TRDRNA2_/TRDRNA2_134798_c0_seq1.p1 gnl/TRDRNA2_/TRDRNA2_134798_c0~~gnl/TRDRNA2_/TRDRNA2_134798_c0_seq1.p1  ORF type:complete len:315 (+),score=74.53 gnl/TRDRNA2_/TRDRNA2_134798_c0_seq1:135-947(+)
MKEFASQLASRYQTEAYGNAAARVGVVQFGNGEVLDDNTISLAEQIIPLSGDMKEVKDAVKGMKVKPGFTNMAQAFVVAKKMSQNHGRKRSPAIVVVITSSKPAFMVQTTDVVHQLWESGIQTFTVSLAPFANDEAAKLVQELASRPTRANFMHIAGVKELKTNMASYVSQVLAKACPRVNSPSGSSAADQMNGFTLISEGHTCKEGRTLIAKGMSAPKECSEAVTNQQGKFFSFGVGLQHGECWIEKTKDAGCKKGWEASLSDFYQIIL